MSENKEVNQKIKASTTSNHNNNSHNNNNQSISFHDPLLNPPPNKVNEWPCGLMILVPLRLGLDRTNPVYFDVRCLFLFFIYFSLIFHNYFFIFS